MNLRFALPLIPIATAMGILSCLQNSDPVVKSHSDELKFAVVSTTDSVAFTRKDTLALTSFPDYDYTGDSDMVRIAKTRDTVTFTYRSYFDGERSSKNISSSKFSLVTTPSGGKIIYGEVVPYFDDAIIIGDSTRYSLSAKVVIPNGLEKGLYRLVMRMQVACFCVGLPTYYYSKEFTVP